MFLGREPMDPNSQEFNDLQAYVASLTPSVLAKMKQFEKERAEVLRARELEEMRKATLEKRASEVEDLERSLREALGVTRVTWLGRGIAGDDTHGHVDDVCRFVGPKTIVLCQEEDPRDENHRPLRENLERLQDARLPDGSRPEVVPLPMPSPLRFGGRRLPASYANFYVANAAVLVPTFNDPKDRIALGILSELFRDRPVIGIHAVDLVWGLGTLHCLTQQQPGGSSLVLTPRS